MLVMLIEAICVKWLMIWLTDDPSASLDRAILYVILVEIAFSPYVYTIESKENADD